MYEPVSKSLILTVGRYTRPTKFEGNLQKRPFSRRQIGNPHARTKLYNKPDRITLTLVTNDIMKLYNKNMCLGILLILFWLKQIVILRTYSKGDIRVLYG